MKKILAAVLTMMLLAICTAGFAAGEPEYTGTIDIGLCFGTTGANALVGVAYVQGITEVMNQVNAAGGVKGHKINLDLVDCGDDADTAMNAMNLLVEKDLSVIIGPHFSSQTFAVKDLIESSGIPTIVGGTNYKLPSTDNNYLFLGRTNDQIQAGVLASYISENTDAEKVGILYSSDDFGQGGFEVASQRLTENGIEFVAEAHNLADTDYYSTLLKMKEAGCDAYLVWTVTAPMTLIVRQVAELGLNESAEFFFGPGFGDNALQNAVDHSWLDGMYCVQETFIDTSNEEIMAFCEAYEESFGEVPDSPARGYATIAMVLVDALERAEDVTDPESVKKALEETKNVKTIFNSYTCDEYHMICHSITICQWDAEEDGLTFVTLFEG